MQFDLYEWVYIITGILFTYTIHKFMDVFFDTKRTSKTVELSSYIGYFIITTAIYFFINVPAILLAFNIITFIGLTFNYESTMKKRILSVIFIYLILVCVEILVGLLTGYLNFQFFASNNYSSIFGIISARVLSYAIVLMLQNYKNIRRGEFVPTSSWLCIALIPIFSLYVILLLLQARGISSVQIIWGIILALLVNFTTFYLYDIITAIMSERLESLLVLEQNKYYDKQLELMKASLQTTGMIRHDLKNHMLVINSLIQNNNRNEAINYISAIMENMTASHGYASSGNIIIDSIINFKFQEAEQKGIATNLDLNVPENLDMPSFDMTIILGNLLDNAVRAASMNEEKRYINVTLKYDKGRLLLQVVNSFTGKVLEKDGKFLTTKEDKEHHGIGLESIRKVVNKYDGTINLDYREGVFSVTILMYLDSILL